MNESERKASVHGDRLRAPHADRADAFFGRIALSNAFLLLAVSAGLLLGLYLLVAWGAQSGYYAQDQVSSVFLLVSCGWLSILFWRAATLLKREHAVRRRGEAALFETNALLRAVSDNTPDGIFIRDREGRFMFANPALAAVFGKAASALVGHTIGDILPHAGDAQAMAASDRAVLDAARPMAVEETFHLDSGTRTFHSTKAPWLGFHGELLGVVGINTDITARKRIEDALRAHETQLEALVAARTAEVSELIGHLETTREEEKRAIARELHDEMGAALTALGMHLPILFAQLPDTAANKERTLQVRGLLATIVQTTRRIQRGLRPDKLDIFGLKTAIGDQVREFGEYAGVTCKVRLPENELAYSPAIDIALFRMVQEALNNIAKHAQARQVDVVLDDTDETIMLTVRDDGVGIPVSAVSATATHGLRGMRERAGYLGGTVSVISRPGHGTTIRVHLPKTVQRHPATVDYGVPAAGTALNPA
jgi:PAS domain S-box-containing protein